MSEWRFKPGDRVVFARPDGWADAQRDGVAGHVGEGAVGTIVFRSTDAYQYRVEYRYGPLTCWNYPFDRQLDPAPADASDAPPAS